MTWRSAPAIRAREPLDGVTSSVTCGGSGGVSMAGSSERTRSAFRGSLAHRLGVAQHARQGSSHDRQVEPDRLTLDIFEIEGDAPPDRLGGVHRTARAVDRGPAG